MMTLLRWRQANCERVVCVSRKLVKKDNLCF